MNNSPILSASYFRRRSLSLSSIGLGAVILAYLIFCVSDTLLVLNDERSQTLKAVAFGLLCIAIVFKPRFHRSIFLIGPLLFFLLISLMRSVNSDAGLEEFLRFLFPIVITIAVFAYRDRLDTLVAVFVAVVISNDLAQCYFYLAYFTGLPLLLPIHFDTGIFLRAQGWIGFFSEFSFTNFCAFMLCRWLRPTNLSRRSSWIFLIFAMLGFSFKLFVPLLFYPLIVKKAKLRVWILMGAGVVGAMIAFFNGILDSFMNVALSKLSFYVTTGNSARAESYRVMCESLMGGNFLGEGLGTFGGPASVRYGSPLYSKYHFDWYGLGGVLRTTDTFYPHLFVEMGLLGALTWLLFVLFYGQGGRRNMPWIFVVVAFCFDNLFSMAILSPPYVFSALITMHILSRKCSGSHCFPVRGYKGMTQSSGKENA
ncbi:hypothetical protein [Paraburkholderia fungorum]|uniref:O-antigen ligase domain-containing protein n=1 Tax=Paraburkholderia fungorum TaxID=134537 RepID=A0AAW3UN93_9BURK|nr:hypothetical protein [Paraburkholderia fungorum]MBB4511989.1 hypothetical protein [Paraburkholderia fungorum]MBB6199895.1 hypothetical protein [Paraburkholderia fungorum]